MYSSYRKDAHAGEILTDNGSLRFAEDYHGEYFYFDVYDSSLEETKRIILSPSEVYAIAKVGVLTESFDVESLAHACEDINEEAYRRQEFLRRMAESRSSLWHTHRMPADLDSAYDEAHLPLTDIFEDSLAGGDGTPEYVSVDGWGTIDLTAADKYRGC